MLARIALVLAFALVPAFAQAADVQMGSVTLKLPPQAGQCEMTTGQASDARLIGMVTQAVTAAGNDLLALSADCDELKDWRTGKRPLLEHTAQYQTQKSMRDKPFMPADALAGCADIKARGEQINQSVLQSTKEAVNKAAKSIDFQDQSVIGVMADDPNGCYVALLQKLKAETGKQIVQVNVFFLGSIKQREIFYYSIAPYVNDQSVSDLVAKEQAHIAMLKSLNP